MTVKEPNEWGVNAAPTLLRRDQHRSAFASYRFESTKNTHTTSDVHTSFVRVGTRLNLKERELIDSQLRQHITTICENVRFRH